MARRNWRVQDSNLRRRSHQIYSLAPLTARETLRQNPLLIAWGFYTRSHAILIIPLSFPRSPPLPTTYPSNFDDPSSNCCRPVRACLTTLKPKLLYGSFAGL